jgi:hypothetical protein
MVREDKVRLAFTCSRQLAQCTGKIYIMWVGMKRTFTVDQDAGVVAVGAEEH